MFRFKLLLYIFAIQCLPHLATNGQEHEPQIIGPQSERIAQLRLQLERSEMVAQIHGSLQQLSETARIRQQLQEAIEMDSYAQPAIEPQAEYDDQSITDATPPAFDLIRFLLGRSDASDTDGDQLGASNPLEANNDDTLREFIRTSLEQAITKHQPATTDSDLLGLQPAIIDESLVGHLFDDDDPAAPLVSKQQLREALELVSVTEDQHFQLGGNVNQWHVLQTANNIGSGGPHALIGIEAAEATVLLVREQNGTYQTVQQLALGSSGPITASATFVQWTAEAQLDGYVMVAVTGELLFIRVRNDLSEMHVAWRWSLLPRVTALLHFRADGADRLLLATAIDANSTAADGSAYSADVYHLDAHAQQTWLMQKIPIADELHTVQFMDLARENVLIMAQTDSVRLLSCARGGDAHHFEPFKTVDAPLVGDAVAGFQIGGLAYIAIGGMRPQILRYHRAEFFAQTVLASSWGHVERIVAIPARTYRDDLIVLVQHRLRVEGAEAAAVLEALIWTGLAFQTAAVAVPCRLNDGRQFAEGIGCMLDSDRREGIAGASVIQRGTQISLLVPRERAPSGLFRLEFRLEAVLKPEQKDSEGREASGASGDMQYSHGDLLEQLNAQTDVITEAENALLNSVNTADGGAVTGDWWVDTMWAGELKIPDAQQALQYRTMQFGAEPWTERDAGVDVAAMLTELDALRRQLEELESEVDSPVEAVQQTTGGGNGQFNIDRMRVLPREKRADAETLEPSKNIQVKHLHAEFINDVPVQDFVFVSPDGTLDLSAFDVLLDGDRVQVNKEVQLSPIVGDSHTRFTGANVHIAGDVSVGDINGRSFNDLMREVVLRDVDNVLDAVEVTGNITFADTIQLNHLNEFAFPDDFLWSAENSADETLVTGAKTFTHKLGTIEADVVGLLNGHNIEHAVTLSTPQTLNGHTTFADLLQVTESLDVTGNIEAPHIREQLANPSLLQTQFVSTDCVFTQLVVNGPVFVHDSLHGVNLDQTLGDVVYRSDGTQQVTGLKTFEQLQAANVQLTSGLVNDVRVDQFMTSDTEQTVEIDSFAGTVIFKQLQLGGLFDFVNVTELDANAVRVSGDQYTDVELIFDGQINDASDDGVDVEAANIDVQRSLNGYDVQQLVPIDQSIEITTGSVELDTLDAINLELRDGARLASQGVLNGQDLNVLDATRLSLSRPQSLVTAPFFIRNLRISGDFDAQSINGQPAADVRRHLQAIAGDNVVQYLSQDAATRLATVRVDGDVRLGRVNGHDFGVIQANAIWLDRENRIETRLQFESPIDISGDLNAINVNGQPFDAFVAGTVRSDRLENLQFSGVQTFAFSPTGVQDLNTGRLGSLDAASILTTRTTSVRNLTVAGSMQTDRLTAASESKISADLSAIGALYVFDQLNAVHVLSHPNVRFDAGTQIEALWLRQATPNVSDLLINLVPKRGPIRINNIKTFTGRVSIDNDLHVEVLNNRVGMPELMDAIVLNEPNSSVRLSGELAFEQTISVSRLWAAGDITVGTIASCDWTDWLRQGVRIDLPLMWPGRLTFEALQADNIQANLVNGVPVESMITLHTEQTFNETVRLGSVETLADVPVDGWVNGVDLRAEAANTLMISGQQQVVTAPTNFESIRVLSSMQTVGAINNAGIDLNQVVALDGDAELTGAFSFASLQAQELQTGSHLVSGIDFAHWSRSTLLRNASGDPQTVTGHWMIGELQADHVDGPQTTVNGHRFDQLEQRVDAHGSGDIVGAMADGRQAVTNLCRDMHALVNRSQQFGTALGHFDEMLRIESTPPDATINSVHLHRWDGIDYLLMNAGCATHLYSWETANQTFEPMGGQDTGAVAEWAMLAMSSNGELRWATNSAGGPTDLNCTHSGLNVWQFRNDSGFAVIRNIATAGEYRMYDRGGRTTETFYALHIAQNMVREFDWDGGLVDEWQLPADELDANATSAFVFLPTELNFGLALSDGQRLSKLSPTANVTKLRAKRFFDEPWAPLGATKKVSGGSRKRERMEPALQPLWTLGGQRQQKPVGVPEWKLKMFRSETPPAPLVPWSCNLTWPKCNLGWWKQNKDKTDSPSDTLGMMHLSDDQSSGGQPEAELVDIMQKVDDSPEEVVMAIPPIFLDDEDDANQTKSTDVGASLHVTTTESTIDRIKEKAEHLAEKVKDNALDAYSNIKHKAAKLAQKVAHRLDDALNKESSTHAISFSRSAEEEQDATTTETPRSKESSTYSSYRTDTFGQIEAKAKPVVDRIMDAQIGPPQSDHDDSDDVSAVNQVQSSSEWNNETTQSPINSSLLRIDTFGRIEAQAKKLADKIMEAQIGPPADGTYDHDEDDDLSMPQHNGNTAEVVTTESPSTDTPDNSEQNEATTLGAVLLSVPQELASAQHDASNATETDTPNSTDADPQVGGILDVLRNVGIATRLSHRIVEELREDYNSLHASDEARRRLQHEPHNEGHAVQQPQHIDDEQRVDDVSTKSVDGDDATVGSAVNITESAAGVNEHEPSIGRVIVNSDGGVATALNPYLPARRPGSELVALDVGTDYRRLLVGVSEWSADMVKGQEDRIRIYEDIVDGRIFQTITCHRPRSLVAMRVGSDTALAFVERDAELRVLVYRGIEGFVEHTSVVLPARVDRVLPVALGARDASACQLAALAVRLPHELRLLEVVRTGYCGMSAAALPECE